jgi:hypothetical protein
MPMKSSARSRGKSSKPRGPSYRLRTRMSPFPKRTEVFIFFLYEGVFSHLWWNPALRSVGRSVRQFVFWCQKVASSVSDTLLRTRFRFSFPYGKHYRKYAEQIYQSHLDPC